MVGEWKKERLVYCLAQSYTPSTVPPPLLPSYKNQRILLLLAWKQWKGGKEWTVNEWWASETNTSLSIRSITSDGQYSRINPVSPESPKNNILFIFLVSLVPSWDGWRAYSLVGLLVLTLWKPLTHHPDYPRRSQNPVFFNKKLWKILRP